MCSYLFFAELLLHHWYAYRKNHATGYAVSSVGQTATGKAKSAKQKVPSPPACPGFHLHLQNHHPTDFGAKAEHSWLKNWIHTTDHTLSGSTTMSNSQSLSPLLSPGLCGKPPLAHNTDLRLLCRIPMLSYCEVCGQQSSRGMHCGQR